MPDLQLLDLIGLLYDAAADPRLWSGMASRIAGVFGSTSTVIKLHGGSARFQLLETTENLLVPDRLRSWAEDWHRRDLWVERSIAPAPSRVVTGDALVDPEE